jgi:hypothetical protein
MHGLIPYVKEHSAFENKGVDVPALAETKKESFNRVTGQDKIEDFAIRLSMVEQALTDRSDEIGIVHASRLSR